MAITTDSLWRWGFVAAAHPDNDGRYYDDLWERAIRWLIKDPDLHHLHIVMDSQEYLPGTTARAEIKLYRPNYLPAQDDTVSIRVYRLGETGTAEVTHESKITIDKDGRGVSSFDVDKWGTYRVEATATVGPKQERSEDLFVVRNSSVESDIAIADPAQLKRVADATNGTFRTASDSLPTDLAFVPPRVTQVNHIAQIELWSRPLILILALGFLGVEWLLRRRLGFL